jgi:hypothetical protein
MSDTPRTDAATEHYFTGGLRSASVVRQNFARELERELNAANAENALLRVEVAQRTAERDEARREILKVLKHMYTTTGLRLELSRRGWWEWYKEVRP